MGDREAEELYREEQGHGDTGVWDRGDGKTGDSEDVTRGDTQNEGNCKRGKKQMVGTWREGHSK